jgi:pimeloyl-ACP methyl ester carboxylesterase
MPRTFQMVATDLHQLLHAAGVTPPYVFVAKGDAASHIRVYHGLYPNEVAGVVMVNANDVDENDVEIPESAKGGWAKHFGSFAPRVRGTACTVFPLLAQTGLVRLGSMFQGLRRTDSMNLQSQEQTMLDFLSDNPTAARGSELCAREISMEQVRASGTLGNVPLIVMATVRRISTNDSSETAAAIAWNKNQAERVQPGLVRLSSRGHLILLDEDVNMQMMIGAIREVVAPAAR